MTDLPFRYPDAAAPTGVAPKPRPCRRHDWAVSGLIATHETVPCVRCGKPRDDAVVRQNRTNRQAGHRAERYVASVLPDGKRVGQYGTPVDVESPWAVAQVKAGHRYSLVDEADLDRMTAYANGKTRLLIKVKRPGPGRPKRIQISLRLSQLLEEFGDALVVVDLPDWQDLKVGGAG